MKRLHDNRYAMDFCVQPCSRRRKYRIRQLWLLVVLLVVCGCSSRTSEVETADSSNTKYASLGSTAEYVGISVCQSCHSNVYDTFIEAEMGRSFRVGMLSNSDADFDNPEAVYDTTANLYYQAFHKNDEIFLREFRLAGSDTVYSRVEKIDYIVGSGQHTNSHIMEENGFLYQMPITWYSQDRKWELPPKYRQFNYRFSRPIPLACMSCHNAIPDFVEGSENKFDAVPHGIDCERCHGPGSEHVERIRAGLVVNVDDEIDYSIVNPGKLAADRQFDICQSCHMQGAAVFKDGKSPTDFRPGMDLSTVQNVFWPRSADSVDTFIMASHPDRLKMSECFIQSQDSLNAVAPLTCITCHNPHVGIETLANDYYNNTCQSCHTTQSVAECSEPIEKRREVNNNCVSCHMPKSGSSDIPHVRITDHFIRPIRTGDQRAVTAGQLEEEDRTYSLASLIDANPTDAEIAEGFLTYFEEKTNQPGFVDSAKVYLRKAERSGLSRKSLAPIWIRAWFWDQDYASIKGLVSQTSIDDIDDSWTHYRVGEAFLSTGLAADAIPHFQRAVDLEPLNLRFLSKLALGFSENHDNRAAIEIYNHLLELNPKYESAYNNRGFARLVSGDLPGAEADFVRSLELFPDGEMALANLASVYYNTGRQEQALELVDRLLIVDPSNEDYVQFRAAMEE